MFLTNRQALFLTGILVFLLLLAGILDIMDNLMVIILIVGGFLVVVVNLVLELINKKNPD